MFKFDFKLDDDEVDDDLLNVAGPSSSGTSSIRAKEENGSSSIKGKAKEVLPCFHHSLDELISTLPETISYSPLYHASLKTPLLRRDLFDARFQLISEPTVPNTRISNNNTSSPRGPGSGGPKFITNTSNDGQSTKDESDTSDIDNQSESNGEEYVDAATDLIPGLYEGGLKTWEGGVDLVEVLAEVESGDGVGDLGDWIKGSDVLEIGCGTALPTAYLLRSLLALTLSSSRAKKSENGTSTSTSASIEIETSFHLQDYNHLVLSLVTLPNLILATLPFLPPELLIREDNVSDTQKPLFLPDWNEPGNLDLTPKLLDAFKSLLQTAGVTLNFTSGDWSGFAQFLEEDDGNSSAKILDGQSSSNGSGFETGDRAVSGSRRKGGKLVMTAETIYSEDSVDSLLDVLKASFTSASASSAKRSSGTARTATEKAAENGLTGGLQDLEIKEKNHLWSSVPLRESEETVILVAAKVLYFGVGGGIQSFLSLLVQKRAGWWVGVKDWIKGVGRKVVRVGW